MARPSGTRMVLSEQQAREIFQLKNTHGFSSLHAASIFLANTHKVSPKAIRDIWKGRSWLDATFDLWDSSDRPPRKVLGRPKGRKDTKPRQSKSIKAAQTQPSNSTSDFPAFEALIQKSNPNNLIHEASICHPFTSSLSTIEVVDSERRASFGASGPALLPPFRFVCDPLGRRFDPTIAQAEQRLPQLNSQLLLQNLMTNSMSNSRIPHEYPAFMANPSFPSLPSSPFPPSSHFFQSARISLLMHQLASPSPIYEPIGGYGCPPLSQPHHRAYNPLDTASAAWTLHTLETPLGLLAPPRSGPALAPAEAAHLLSIAHMLGH
jgi:hypothetical protein